MRFEYKNGNFVLIISYGNYLQSRGGTDRFLISMHNTLHQKRISTVYIFDFLHYFNLKQSSKLPFWGVIIDGKYVGVADTTKICHFLYENCESCKGIIINHLLNISIEQVSLITNVISVPVQFYIHDYFLLCDQRNLLTNGEHLCNYSLPGPQRCSGCKYGKETIDRVRNVIELLSTIDNFVCIAPSEPARKIFLSTYPQLREKTIVIPHLILSGNQSKHGNSRNISFLGSPHWTKGYNVWKKICGSVPGYSLFQFGRKIEHIPGVENVDVRFSVSNINPMTEALRSYNIGIVLLWSKCPETYSYTYYESVLANCFVITNTHSGNIAFEVQRRGNGVILASEEEVIDLLRNYEKLDCFANSYWEKASSPYFAEDNPAFLNYLGDAKKNRKPEIACRRKRAYILLLRPMYWAYRMIYYFLRG